MITRWINKHVEIGELRYAPKRADRKFKLEIAGELIWVGMSDGKLFAAVLMANDSVNRVYLDGRIMREVKA